MTSSNQWIVSPALTVDHDWTASTVPAIVTLRRASGGPIFLRSTLRFSYEDSSRFPGERRVKTTEYAHTVGESFENLKPQLYSWEWSSTEKQYPHVHVRRSNPDFHGLGKLHIPTGRVFFEHVLLFLLGEHDVEPVHAHKAQNKWREILGDNLGRASKFSTWGGGQAPRVSNE